MPLKLLVPKKYTYYQEDWKYLNSTLKKRLRKVERRSVKQQLFIYKESLRKIKRKRIKPCFWLKSYINYTQDSSLDFLILSIYNNPTKLPTVTIAL